MTGIKEYIMALRNKIFWGKIEKKHKCVLRNKISTNVPHNHDYMITPINHLKFVERYLSRKHITKNDRIIDIGCGLGGMLFFFYLFPFGCVSGLEYSEEIAAMAKKNVEDLNPLPEIIVGDAVTFKEYDEFNYFYLFNPFDAEIMGAFIDNIDESIERRPRRIRIIYVNSLYADCFLKAGYRITSYYKRSIMHRSETMVFEKNGEMT